MLKFATFERAVSDVQDELTALDLRDDALSAVVMRPLMRFLN